MLDQNLLFKFQSHIVLQKGVLTRAHRRSSTYVFNSLCYLESMEFVAAVVVSNQERACSDIPSFSRLLNKRRTKQEEPP